MTRLRLAVAGLRRGERGIAVVAGVSPAADTAASTVINSSFELRHLLCAHES
jgi:hypothetical protein